MSNKILLPANMNSLDSIKNAIEADVELVIRDLEIVEKIIPRGCHTKGEYSYPTYEIANEVLKKEKVQIEIENRPHWSIVEDFCYMIRSALTQESKKSITNLRIEYNEVNNRISEISKEINKIKCAIPNELQTGALFDLSKPVYILNTTQMVMGGPALIKEDRISEVDTAIVDGDELLLMLTTVDNNKFEVSASDKSGVFTGFRNGEKHPACLIFLDSEAAINYAKEKNIIYVVE